MFLTTKRLIIRDFSSQDLDALSSILRNEEVMRFSMAGLKVAARMRMHYWKDATFHGISVQIYALNKVVVVPFNSSWKTLFDEEKERLSGVFKNLQIDFFHIGSTSIEGCSAKPVIDILGVTSDVLEIDRFNQEMIAIGFKPLGEYGMKQRRFFQRKYGVPVNLQIDDTYNYALAARFTDHNVRDRVRHIKSLFDRFHLPFSWWVSESDSPSNLGDALLNEGLCFKEKNVGMFLHLNGFSPVPPLSSLVFQRVESAAQLKSFATVIESVGGSPLSFECIYSHLPPSIYAGDTSVELYLANFEGRPSITGVLVTHANVAGFYYVATVPDLRKRGFGTAMMYYLLQRAQNKGYSIATLQASQHGCRLYERLGFLACCAFSEYALSKN